MSKLILVPTPIGNLGDITIRGLKVLEEVDFVLAEDTRVSIKLFKHFNLSKKLVSYHQHNEHYQVERIVDNLLSGQVAALISDAGTPGISDPGYLIVKKCIESGVDVETLPGPTAFVPALVNSGFPSDRFCFEGFLPQKKGRNKRLSKLIDEERTMVFYESPYRVVKTLEQFATFFGEKRKVSVSREISKLFEETIRGELPEVIAHFKEKGTKGEFVIVLEGLGKGVEKDNG